MQKITLKIPAIHCQGCVKLIESELKNLSGIKSTKIDLAKKEAEIELDSEKTSQEEVLSLLSSLNYPAELFKSSASSRIEKQSRKEIILSILTIIIFLAVYLAIGHWGGWSLLGEINSRPVSYGLALLIGFLASFHCIGMCGGLVISYTLPGDVNSSSPSVRHWLYNLGRLISYTTLGAVLGAIGSFFSFSPIINALIMLLAGLFMIFMGMSFVSENRVWNKLKLKTPDKIATIVYANKKNKTIGPFIIGLLTAFMPCGPLQAMLLYALSTGSAWHGGLTMAAYAAGTIPMLLGFGYFVSFWSQRKLRLLVKFSGLVVIFLGLTTSGRALANISQSMGKIENQGQLQAAKQSGYQVVEMAVTYQGFKPNTIYIKKGVPVKWIIRDQGITGCTNEIILYNKDKVIQKKLDSQENIIEFTPSEEGEIKFSCWMKMVWGKFIVTADGQASAETNTISQTETTPSGGCSGGCAGNGGTCSANKNGTCGLSKENSSTGCGCGLKK